MKLQAQHIGFDNAVAILNQGIQAIDSGDSVMDMQDVRKTDSAGGRRAGMDSEGSGERRRAESDQRS